MRRRELYRIMEHPGGIFGRWRLAREAERLNAIRLEVVELLTERSRHSLTFLGGMYDALAAQRIGVDDCRSLVAGKLHTAGELYNFLIE